MTCDMITVTNKEILGGLYNNSIEILTGKEVKISRDTFDNIAYDRTQLIGLVRFIGNRLENKEKIIAYHHTLLDWSLANMSLRKL